MEMNGTATFLSIALVCLACFGIGFNAGQDYGNQACVAQVRTDRELEFEAAARKLLPAEEPR